MVTKIHFSPYNLEGKEKKMYVESFIAKGKFRVTTSCNSNLKNRTSIGRWYAYRINESSISSLG